MYTLPACLNVAPVAVFGNCQLPKYAQFGQMGQGREEAKGRIFKIHTLTHAQLIPANKTATEKGFLPVIAVLGFAVGQLQLWLTVPHQQLQQLGYSLLLRHLLAWSFIKSMLHAPSLALPYPSPKLALDLPAGRNWNAQKANIINLKIRLSVVSLIGVCISAAVAVAAVAASVPSWSVWYI